MATLPGCLRYDWIKRSEILKLLACIERWDPENAEDGCSYSLDIY